MSLDALRDLNEIQAQELGHPETLTRIAQYELAFRMQTSVPEVMDISREPKAMLEAYGAQPGASSFANNCLLARRLVEQGVRFVQLFDWGWDFHGTGPGEDIRDGLTKKCATMDRPVAALIKDLKQRGLLDDTLIIWGGEFGRTPFREGRTAGSAVLGRDHYPDCYTMFLAGGGVKPGFTHGESDELGFSRRPRQGPRPRPAGHDPAPARLRPHAADLPLPGPRLPPDRRPRQGRQADPGLSGPFDFPGGRGSRRAGSAVAADPGSAGASPSRPESTPMRHERAFALAKEQYEELGVDVDAALARLGLDRHLAPLLAGGRRRRVRGHRPGDRRRPGRHRELSRQGADARRTPRPTSTRPSR